MAMTRAEILKSALDLSEQDRLILADELLGSIPDELFDCQDDDTPVVQTLSGCSPQTSWESFLNQLQLETNRPVSPSR